MDFKLLTSFVAIAEYGSISQAADALYTTQPNLSKQLKNLEVEYSAKLIERTNRRLSLTPEGRILYRHAKRILSLSDTSHREISSARSGISGLLSLGVMPTALYSWQRSIFPEYYRLYPNVKYNLYEGSTFDILDNLHAGMFNICVLRTPFNTSGLDTYSFSTDALVACYTSDALFDGWGNTIPLDALQNVPLVMIHRIRKIIEPLCTEKGFEPDIVSLCDQTVTNINWAKSLPVCAIVPITLLDSIALPENMKYKIIDDPGCYSDTVVALEQGRFLSTPELNFLQLLFDINWHAKSEKAIISSLF